MAPLKTTHANASAGVREVIDAADINAIASSVNNKGNDVKVMHGAKGDGVTDDTAAIQAASTAAGVGGVLIFPPGTYVVTSLTGLSGQTWIGSGRGTTIIKRKAASVANYVVWFSGKSGFRISDLTIDGNKANQTVGANNIVIEASSDWSVERVGSINAKAASGYGTGIAVSDGANAIALEMATIRNCRVVDNDGGGIVVIRDHFINVEANFCRGNGGGGISVSNYVFPPVADTQNYITIVNNQCHYNTGSGIQFVGFFESGASLAVAVWGPTVPPSRHIVISGNHCRNNTIYGIAFQGGSVAFTGNTMEFNGSSVNNGGCLFGAYASTFTGNVLAYNSGYGIDAGGCAHCVISGNQFLFNGLTFGGTDINIGAAVFTVVTGNQINQSGTAACSGIACSGIDGPTVTDPFPFLGSGNSIIGNKIVCNGQAGSAGIILSRTIGRMTVQNNTVHGSAAGRAFVFVSTEVLQGGNLDYTNGGPVPTLASAGSLIIPDAGDQYYVSGTTNITSILSVGENTYSQKVRDVVISNGGSGYSQLSPPTVTFTGGGGSGAAATAVVSKAGQVIGVLMTNPGSGYTSTPTVGFSSGAAAGVALVGCPNTDGRVVTFLFLGSLTVTDGSNLLLAGNLVTGANGATLTLRGAFGNWYEVSRAVL